MLDIGLVGMTWAEGARKPLLGVVGADLIDDTVEMLPVLLRVLFMGSAGSAVLGGPLEGRDGLGIVVAMVSSCRESEAIGVW